MRKLILFFLTSMISYSAYAIDCPPSSCTTTFASTTFHLLLDDFSQSHENADVYVRAGVRHRRNCDGDIEIIIDDIFLGSTGTSTHEFFDEFNYLHYSYSSITEWAALDILMIIDGYGLDNAVPFCSTNTTITRVQVYTASCGIWTKCSYKLPETIEKVCDTGWQGGDPHYAVPNPGPPPSTDYYVDHWKWQSCGEVCCKKVFELCRDQNISYPGFYVKITAMTKSKYPEDAECSKQGDFTGPRPLPTSPVVELPCEDGC